MITRFIYFCIYKSYFNKLHIKIIVSTQNSTFQRYLKILNNNNSKIIWKIKVLKVLRLT